MGFSTKSDLKLKLLDYNNFKAWASRPKMKYPKMWCSLTKPLRFVVGDWLNTI
jgi:hypothetical protein